MRPALLLKLRLPEIPILPPAASISHLKAPLRGGRPAGRILVMPEADRDQQPDATWPDEPDEGKEVAFEDVLAAADGLSSDDPDWIDLQWYVADTLHDRFLDHGDWSDLDEAIRRGRLVVAAQEPASPAHLHDLALMLWDRVEAGPSAADLGEYVDLLSRALALIGAGEEDPELKAKCQANLATGLMSRQRYEASDPDRDRAVSLWESALGSGTLDDDVQAGVAANLAQALSWSGAAEDDLRRAVEWGRRAVATPLSDPEEAAHNEFALATVLANLHDVAEDDGLLEEAINQVRSGLAHLGPTHPDTPGYTANLIGLLRQLTREADDDAPLDEAIALTRQAIGQTTDADVDRVLILTTGAAALSESAARRDDVVLLQEALGLYRLAIDLAPGGSLEQGVALVNLVSTCRDGNERLDAPELIEEGIEAGRRALAIFATPGLHRAAALTALSNTLRDHFVLTGGLADLDEAITLAEEALGMTPRSHPERAARATNLAVVLSDDFTERADRGQLDRAIALYREALGAAERVGARIPERLNDLALALRDRHKDSGSQDDLDEAVRLAEDTVSASRRGLLTWAGYANNLGNALAERYELAGDPADLDRAVELFESALADARGRAFESSGYATNLGLAFAARALLTGSMSDMDQALLRLAGSVDVLPPDYPDRAHRLSNLADGYRQRSIMMDNAGHPDLAHADAVAAVDIAHDAVGLAGSSDARLLPALSNLALALRWQRQLAPTSVAIEDILQVQRRAALLNDITPAEKFGQSGRWARDAEEAGVGAEAMQAYARAVSLTTEVAWIGLGAYERLTLLQEMNEVLSRAVAFAATADEPWLAVVWADHVRSVLWRQDLSVTALGRSRGDTELVALSGLRSVESVDEAPDEHRREKRRRRAHAEREMLQLPMATPSDYMSADLPGVVVLLASAGEASLAIVLRNRRPPKVITLPGAPEREVTAWVQTLRDASTAFDRAEPGNLSRELAARHATFDCLDWLWQHVADPILREICTEPGPRQHVWWSPVGDFALLPIHAAGRHPRKSTQFARRSSIPLAVQDLVFSSYLPTVLFPRPARTDSESGASHLLYVAPDASANGLEHLEHERAAVRATLRGIEVVELVDAEATIEAVRSAIPRCRYLHVAGHGSVAPGASFESGFQVTDGLFTLRDLADCDARSGVLAVLLTCDSAAGDVQSPNEALHAAGAAHQAGFAEVVAATMPVRDSSAVAVVRTLYEALDGDPEAAGASIPAALDAVVQSLRLDPTTGADPLTWVPYAHFGAGIARST